MSLQATNQAGAVATRSETLCCKILILASRARVVSLVGQEIEARWQWFTRGILPGIMCTRYVRDFKRTSLQATICLFQLDPQDSETWLEWSTLDWVPGHLHVQSHSRPLREEM